MYMVKHSYNPRRLKNEMQMILHAAQLFIEIAFKNFEL